MTTRIPAPIYCNPILNADWPDPDAVQVDGVYYLISSSFNRVPGLPVLRSRNLVDWEHAGHALTELPQTSHYSLVRHGSGVWAPALRYHDGRFWIFYPDPDHGIFVLSAEKAEGPWTTPHLLYPGRGLIDPCPLWDDDGQTYLVHGWAQSRVGVKNRLTVHRMSPDASRLLDHGTHVINGADLPGYSTLEGPKFYKRDGWYWIFAPAGGVATGWQSVFRSRSPFGPYEGRRVLEQGKTEVNGPHQGAWVTSPRGEDWFLHFQDRGPYGRVVHLQPMGWSEDGWPWMGVRDSDGKPGTPVITHPYPLGTAAENMAPPASDDFSKPHLGPQWHWQANPRADWAHQCGGGHLVLKPKANDPVNLRELPNLLGQILPGTPFTFTTSLELHDVPVGTRAGVVVLGLKYAWLGIVRTAEGYVLGDGTGGEGPHEQRLGRQRVLPGSRIELQIRTDGTPRSTFAWRSGPGEPWEVQGWNFDVVKGQWIGAELGLFAASPLGSEEGGNVIVGPVRVDVAPARRPTAPQFAAVTT
ncbi:glycoside hydrolase family 43 protein [Arthrobacter sp. D3-16]